MESTLRSQCDISHINVLKSVTKMLVKKTEPTLKPGATVLNIYFFSMVIF